MSRVVLFVGSALVFSLHQPAALARPAEDAQIATDERIAIAPPMRQLRVGERLSFHGRWFGIPVGSGWIELKEQVLLNGRLAYHVEAQGHSNEFLSTFYPIHDVLHSFLDAETLRPLRFEKYQREGHYRADEVVIFDYDRLIATYRSLLNQSVKEVPIPPDVHDLLSALYWLRLQPLSPPQSVVVNVYSDEKIYRTEIKLLKTVLLELLWRGTFPCLMVEPVATFRGVLIRRGRVQCYLSADTRRLPLLVKIATPWGPITGVIDPESLAGEPDTPGDDLTPQADRTPPP